MAALLVLLLVGSVAGVWLVVRTMGSPEPAPTAALDAPDQASLSPAEEAARRRSSLPEQPAAVAHPPPSFDVVRVGPTGSVVLAGRAAPGDSVSVHDGASLLGTTTADGAGQWVLLPSAPLPPGGRELTVSARSARDPSLATSGRDPVLLVVPERGSSEGGSLALLARPGQAPELLQPPAGERSSLGLDAVSLDDRGGMDVRGHAPPGAGVRLYVDDAPAGDTLADGHGDWTLRPALPLGAGSHQLRVDQLAEGGKVLARVEQQVRRPAPTRRPERGEIVVQRGENLWQLARRAYGTGTQYLVIFRANRQQIRDPAVIRPGQSFVVPQLAQGGR